jgi:antitoxin (DNA-binding transcriptional repressor) of toxin-antitoxin stability system
MRNVTVEELQEKLDSILEEMKVDEEIVILRYGRPVARLIGLGQREEIDWPDFWKEAVSSEGKPIGDIVVDGREDRRIP